MAVIAINVTGHRAELVSADWLATGSAGVDAVRVTADSSWEGFDKSICFKCEGRLTYSAVTDGEAEIPHSVMSAAVIGLALYGTKPHNGFEKRYTTDFVTVAAAAGPQTEPPAPDATIYAQILNVANNADTAASAAVEQAEGAVATSEEAAEQAEQAYTAAVTAQDSATAKAAEAGGYAETAGTKAGEASASATTATTQAGIATSQAGIATGAAGTATTASTEAQTAARTAATKAGEAATSAATATTKANEAASSASAADSSAATATAKAGEAAASATTAQTAAGTATTKASEASGSASAATTQAGIATTQAGLAEGCAERAEAAAETVDTAVHAHETARTAHENALNLAGAIIPAPQGNLVQVTDAAGKGLAGLRLFGKSFQNGTPTPTEPIEIVNLNTGMLAFPTGGNFLPKNTISSRVFYGITITNYGDGSYTLDGEYNSTLFESVEIAVGVMGILGSIYTFGYEYVSGGVSGTASIGFVGRLGSVTTSGNTKYLALSSTSSSETITTSRTSAADTVAFKLSFSPSGCSFDNYTVRPFLSDTGTTYTEYEAQSLTLPYKLRGLKTTLPEYTTYVDGDGQAWYADEVDFERGKLIKRVEEVTFDGAESENWRLIYGCFYANAGTTLVQSTNVYSLCRSFVRSTTYSPSSLENVAFINQVGGNIFFRLDSIAGETDAERITNWKAWLADNPVTVQYPPAIPVETDLTAEELAAYKALHTYRYNTTFSSSVWAETAYTADTKKYIDDKITQTVLALS